MYQEGAQRIIGFDFRASLLMDMTEQPCVEMDGLTCQQCRILFKLVESQMFQAFDGSWTLTHHSLRREYDTTIQRRVEKPTTKLTYDVTVQPKGPVPVLALEWRVK
jgi:isocitrate dehydrogenase